MFRHSLTDGYLNVWLKIIFECTIFNPIIIDININRSPLNFISIGAFSRELV